MKVRLHPEKLKANLDTIGFIIDLAMICLLYTSDAADE